ncbi:GntR family transcriptional regulator [Glutamicibacter ectropisis]|uniref:GntR family transcriptional regulator n=1 Tax=Glutamicibacter ectropisis TaxID=3046593 RepID=A0AAU6WD79_9MICC
MNLVLQNARAPEHTARQHLTEQLRAALLSGQVSAGDPLPSTRTLASMMRVSRGAVVSVYEDLAGRDMFSASPVRAPSSRMPFHPQRQWPRPLRRSTHQEVPDLPRPAMPLQRSISPRAAPRPVSTHTATG